MTRDSISVRRFILLLLALAGGLGLAVPVISADRIALELNIDGAIGPATADYVTRGLKTAEERNAALVILRMDTPGGLDTAMRQIIRAILASPIPVAAYVSPSGARAASAGTYILYASHVAAMAPGTNLGAATPVRLGGGGGLPFGGGGDEKPAPNENEKNGDAKPASTEGMSAMEKKVVNDATAYIRSLAEMRGRNADWAEQAVRQGVSLSASDAQAQNVADLIAADEVALLKAIDGRKVKLGAAEMTLDTAGLSVVPLLPDWRTKLLAAITDPNVALILMMIGIYGLIFEFMNPGVFFPGVIGAICLLIGLYALAALPVNYAGAGLMLLGVALMIGEVFTPSVGALGIGGAISFVLGATILIDTDLPEFEVDWPVTAAVVGITLGFVMLILRMAYKAQRRGVVTGREQMVGASATVLEWGEVSGFVLVHGERWKAAAPARLQPGQRVRIKALHDLTLDVAPDITPDMTPDMNPGQTKVP